jgi:hypothetical protein
MAGSDARAGSTRGATMTTWLAALLALPFIAPDLAWLVGLHPGLFAFLAWAALCVAAVLRGWLFGWAILCALPMIVVAPDWLFGPVDPGDAFHPWGSIGTFAGAAIVIAATALLALLRARQAP